jgi:chemotaxis protein MotB
MKNAEPEKPPNHERWIISYADFTTLLLATFVVMYAVSTINSSKFQQMAESFNTAFMGRTTHVTESGFAAQGKAPFTAMPNPVHVPIVTREPQMKDLPPALRQEKMNGDPNNPSPGQYLPAGGSEMPETEYQGQGEQQEGVKAANPELWQQVENRIKTLDMAYDQLLKALAALIEKGQVRVSLQSVGVVVDINETLLFHSGKADLTPAALPLIDQVSKILVGLPYQIQVNGFTDNVPIHNVQFDSNWDLSATRAISVVKRFVAAGIDPTLVVGSGFGEYHPIATNATPEGKAANRRVSIVVVAPSGKDPTRARMLGNPAERGASPARPAPAPRITAAPAQAVSPAPMATQPAPASQAPASQAPVSQAPVSQAPVSQAPVSPAPVSPVPTSPPAPQTTPPTP